MLIRDLVNMFVRGLSVKPQTTSGTTAIAGTWIDMDSAIGPVVAEITNGTATGTPDTQAHAVKLREADDDNGTGAADITGATATISADNQVTTIQAKNRSKRYVQVHVTPAWTGGESPTTQVSAVLKAQKERF